MLFVIKTGDKAEATSIFERECLPKIQRLWDDFADNYEDIAESDGYSNSATWKMGRRVSVKRRDPMNRGLRKHMKDDVAVLSFYLPLGASYDINKGKVLAEF